MEEFYLLKYDIYEKQKYEKRNIFSDSSDLSDDENLQRSKSKDNKVNKCKNAEIK